MTVTMTAPTTVGLTAGGVASPAMDTRPAVAFW